MLDIHFFSSYSNEIYDISLNEDPEMTKNVFMATRTFFWYNILKYLVDVYGAEGFIKAYLN